MLVCIDCDGPTEGVQLTPGTKSAICPACSSKRGLGGKTAAKANSKAPAKKKSRPSNSRDPAKPTEV